MRRSVTRCLVSLWTLWFALITVGPGGFGACPEHGSGGHNHASMTPAAKLHTMAPAASSEPSPHMHHAAPAGEAESGATQTGATQTGETPPAQHQCTCLGACCMMAPSALPASAVLLVATWSATISSPTPAYRTVLAARRVFSQPYAIGPPAAPIV